MMRSAIGDGVRPRRVTIPMLDASGGRPGDRQRVQRAVADLALDRGVRRGEDDIAAERDRLQHLDVVALERE